MDNTKKQSVYNDKFVDVLCGQWSQSSPKTLIPSVSICHLAHFKLKKARENNSGPLNRLRSNGREKVNWISSLQSFNPNIDPQPDEISGGLLQDPKWDWLGKWDRTEADLVDESNHFHKKFHKHKVVSELCSLLKHRHTHTVKIRHLKLEIAHSLSYKWNEVLSERGVFAVE